MKTVEHGEIIERPAWRRSICYLAGDRVRIISGPLGGLTGVVTEVNAARMCILVIDGIAGGVYCVAPQNTLERSEAPVLSVDPRFPR